MSTIVLTFKNPTPIQCDSWDIERKRIEAELVEQERHAKHKMFLESANFLSSRKTEKHKEWLFSFGDDFIAGALLSHELAHLRMHSIQTSWHIPNQQKPFWLAKFVVKKSLTLKQQSAPNDNDILREDIAQNILLRLLSRSRTTQRTIDSARQVQPDAYNEAIHDLWLAWSEAGKLDRFYTLAYVEMSIKHKIIDNERKRRSALWLGEKYDNGKAIFCQELLCNSSLVPGEAAELLREMYSSGLKEVHAKALFLKAQGHNCKEIGKQLGASHTCVRKWFSDPIAKFLKDKGVSIPKPKKQPLREVEPLSVFEGISTKTLSIAC